MWVLLFYLVIRRTVYTCLYLYLYWYPIITSATCIIFGWKEFTRFSQIFIRKLLRIITSILKDIPIKIEIYFFNNIFYDFDCKPACINVQSYIPPMNFSGLSKASLHAFNQSSICSRDGRCLYSQLYFSIL